MGHFFLFVIHIIINSGGEPNEAVEIEWQINFADQYPLIYSLLNISIDILKTNTMSLRHLLLLLNRRHPVASH